MTKELLKSIEDKYSESSIELEYQSINITQECKEAFIEGYEAAEKQQDEMMIKFAEWVDDVGYLQFEPSQWRIDSTKPHLSSEELLQLFKESLK